MRERAEIKRIFAASPTTQAFFNYSIHRGLTPEQPLPERPPTEEEIKLLQRYLDLSDQVTNIVCRGRNKKLEEVIDYMRSYFPDNKVFVLAGIAHLTDDPDFQAYLDDNDQYIGLEPTYTIPVEEIKKRSLKYYGGTESPKTPVEHIAGIEQRVMTLGPGPSGQDKTE